jgi:hypothetical protein
MLNESKHLLLLKQAVQVSKEPNGEQLLVREHGLGVIAHPLKTSFRRSIVSLADEQVDLD